MVGPATVSPPPLEPRASQLTMRPNYADVFTAEELQHFRDVPDKYLELMHECEDFLNSAHSMTIADSPMQKLVRQRLSERMRETLKANAHIADSIIVRE